MKNRARTAVAIALAAAMTACEKKPQPEPPKPRWQYTQEDFAIGKAHTMDRGCNVEIDAMLEQIRNCYNTREQAECAPLQSENSKKIARLKNSRRCAR